MEEIIQEIIEKLRAGQSLNEKGLLRILNDHNKLLAQQKRHSKILHPKASGVRNSESETDLPSSHQPHSSSRFASGQLDSSSQPRSSSNRHYSKKKLLPFYLCTKDRNPELWASWNITPELEGKLIKLLQVKPRRSASGVATITVITKPWRCSGACIYCPNDLRMPKSYLSDEPACQRAERNYFDPYLQVTSRLRALNQMGHVTDKIELIVLGGSWSDYPRDYQIWFTTELFRALNDASTPANSSQQHECNDRNDQKDQNDFCVAVEDALDPNADSHTSLSGEKALSTLEARKRRLFYKQHGLSYEKEDLIAFTREAQQAVDAGKLTYNAAAHELYESHDPWASISKHQHATLDQLKAEHTRNEQAAHRVVGFVVETRPAAITPETLTFLRTLGATKLQMGIQSLDQRIHDINRRAVSIAQIERALDLARLFGFKTHTHFMVNLLGSTPELDKEDFRRFVTETPYQPDEIKLYPCALVNGTDLCEKYEMGEWQPYDEETLIDVLVADVLATPAFTRISRMIRDFSAHDIMAGNKKVNLRQLVEHRAEQIVASNDTQFSSDQQSEKSQSGESGATPSQQAKLLASQQHLPVLSKLTQSGIKEIRYREISTSDVDTSKLVFDEIPYETTSTYEHFLQWVTPEGKIAGFLRLSLPKPEAFDRYAYKPASHADPADICQKESQFNPITVDESSSYFLGALPITPGEAMIREVHVYGRASSLRSADSDTANGGVSDEAVSDMAVSESKDIVSFSSNAQHKGLGRKLIERASEIAKTAGYEKLNVISAIGTRDYYRRLGFNTFTPNGLYQQKTL